MLFHLSIDANDPQHVAAVLAELFGGGIAAPFPPVSEGSWLAMANDDRNTMIEVYPRGTILHEIPGDADAVGTVQSDAKAIRGSATHFAMATRLSKAAVFAIAEREGWPAKYRRRGDAFGVIELWVDGDRMIEVLTAEMQDEYAGAMTPENWLHMIQAATGPRQA